MLRLILVDDHPLVAQGLAAVLRHHADLQFVGHAPSGHEGRTLVRSAQPDIAVIDLHLPDCSGLDLVRDFRAELPAVRCVILTSGVEGWEVREALQAGVAGYVLKDVLPDELLAALRRVGDGKRAFDAKALEAAVTEESAVRPAISLLSERESEVLRELASGRTNRQIAVRLYITENTVKKHISSILSKLQLTDRTQAAVFALEHRLVSQTSLVGEC